MGVAVCAESADVLRAASRTMVVRGMGESLADSISRKLTLLGRFEPVEA
jgi:hypothetical protein